MLHCSSPAELGLVPGGWVETVFGMACSNLAKRVGLPYTFHDLRPSFCSTLLAAGTIRRRGRNPPRSEAFEVLGFHVLDEVPEVLEQLVLVVLGVDDLGLVLLLPHLVEEGLLGEDRRLRPHRERDGV